MQTKTLKSTRRGKPTFRVSSGTQELTRQFHLERARLMDRQADAELQQGHHVRAEYLAQQAFALRQEGRA